MIGRRSKPHTSLLIVRNEDGTPKQVRVTGKSARHEARLVRDAIQRHGDRVVAVHDSSGTPLYSQGAVAESPAGDRVGRTATEPRTQPEPAPPAVSRTMDREPEPSQPAYRKASVAPSGVAAHDAFAEGARYGQPPADPIGFAEDHTSRINTGPIIPTSMGTAWDLRMPDGTVGQATAHHVVDGDWNHRKVVEDPANDFAVVSGGREGSALELASQDAQPGDQVAIVSAKEGVVPANVVDNRPVQPDGHPNAFNATVVDRPVQSGTSGSSAIQMTPGPDQGKVVGAVSCGDDTQTSLVPASTMRQAIGGSSAPSETAPDEDALSASRAPGIAR